MAVSFIGGVRTRRKPLTWRKSLTNFMLYSLPRVGVQPTTAWSLRNFEVRSFGPCNFDTIRLDYIWTPNVVTTASWLVRINQYLKLKIAEVRNVFFLIECCCSTRVGWFLFGDDFWWSEYIMLCIDCLIIWLLDLLLPL